MPKWSQWVAFGFAAVGAVGAVVKILEYFDIKSADLGINSISSRSLWWGVLWAVLSVLLFIGGVYLRRRKQPKNCTLVFLAWYGGGSRSLPNTPNGTATWVAVKNVAGPIPIEATNVTARLEFRRSGDGAPLIVPE